jgi:hypothetical protein
VGPLVLLVFLRRLLLALVHTDTSLGNSSESVARTTPNDWSGPANSKLSSRDTQRGVRKVLGETSQCYTVSIESATLFLKTTYEQPRSPESDIMGAKATYDACSWAPLSDDDFSLLVLPPSSQEVAHKLKRASNTSPGGDGVDYKDILLLDAFG